LKVTDISKNEIIALVMEAVRTSETLVNFNVTPKFILAAART
jgi:hypothetical protein